MQSGLREFEAWRSCISREALNVKTWAKTFYKVALRKQHLAEQQAAAMAAESFSNWLHEGPTGGAKRQHQLSRTAVGWFPTKVGETQPNELQPIDEVDGLSREQLDSIKLRDQGRGMGDRG